MDYILLILIILFFAFAGKSIIWGKSAKQKGIEGEGYIRTALAKLPEEYHTLNDVVFETNNGNTTQIDHIVISKYAIFAIETKNYVGKIKGADYWQDWTQLIINDVTYRRKWWKTYTYVTKSTFYNPVKQAIGHTKAIDKTIGTHHYIPIVAFVGNVDLDEVRSDHHVIYAQNILRTIQQYEEPYLAEAEVSWIAARLSHRNKRDLITDKQHISNIDKNKDRINKLISQGICPQCGSPLALRNGRYGQFYGCKGYPKCKFTQNKE